MLANTLAVKKTKNTPDCLLYKDKYASDIAMSTLTEMTTILNRMESTIKSKLKVWMLFKYLFIFIVNCKLNYNRTTGMQYSSLSLVISRYIFDLIVKNVGNK